MVRLGALTWLLLLFFLVVSFLFPLVGIPLLLLSIIVLVVFKVTKGTAKATYRGVKWVTGKKPPTASDTNSGRKCPNCAASLLRIPG